MQYFGSQSKHLESKIIISNILLIRHQILQIKRKCKTRNHQFFSPYWAISIIIQHALLSSISNIHTNKQTYLLPHYCFLLCLISCLGLSCPNNSTESSNKVTMSPTLPNPDVTVYSSSLTWCITWPPVYHSVLFF